MNSNLSGAIVQLQTAMRTDANQLMRAEGELSQTKNTLGKMRTEHASLESKLRTLTEDSKKMEVKERILEAEVKKLHEKKLNDGRELENLTRELATLAKADALKHL